MFFALIVFAAVFTVAMIAAGHIIAAVTILAAGALLYWLQ